MGATEAERNPGDGGIEEKQEQEQEQKQEPSWLAAEGGQRREVSGG